MFDIDLETETYAFPWLNIYATRPSRNQSTLSKRFAHGIDDWYQFPAVTAREFAITAAINKITDQPSWKDDVHDPVITSSWRQAATDDSSLITDQTWAWILSELKWKAQQHDEKGFSRVLDTGSCVCKADNLVDVKVASDLKIVLERFPIHRSQNDSRRCEIVSSTRCPLIFGRTNVVRDSTSVPFHKGAGVIDDMFINDDHLATFPTQPEPAPVYATAETLRRRSHERRKGRRQDFQTYDDGDPDSHYWSSHYQALPCDVRFTGKGTEVNITSYVNNLHPRYRAAYEALECIMSPSISMWNECLMLPTMSLEGPSFPSHQSGRYPLRIVTFGAEWENELPKWAWPFCLEGLVRPKAQYKMCEERLTEARNLPPHRGRNLAVVAAQNDYRFRDYRYLSGAPDVSEVTEETWKLAEEFLGTTLDRSDAQFASMEEALEAQNQPQRRWKHPEPGTACSFEDWTTGRNVEKAVVPMIQKPHFAIDEIENYRLFEEPHHRYQEVCLEDTFQSQGLQIIVDIGGVDLMPGQTYCRDWQVEGHMNEHIVATAMYAYDCANMDCEISFSQTTRMPQELYRSNGRKQVRCKTDNPSVFGYDSRDYHEHDLPTLSELFAMPEMLRNPAFADGEGDEPLPMQYTGTVKLQQGRLITFPNVMESTIEFIPFDAALPAHARFVTLRLVDPHYRICSTSHVPPQQRSWWLPSIIEILLRKGLPRELVDIVLSYCDVPLSDEQVDEHDRQMQRESQWLTAARHALMGRMDFAYT